MILSQIDSGSNDLEIQMPNKPCRTCRIFEPLLVSRQQAAALMGISVRALDYLVSNRKIQTRRIGSRVLIPYLELKRFVQYDRPDSVLKAA